MKIGDVVKRIPSTLVDEHNRLLHKRIPATVVYIHPKGRFHTVRYEFPRGSFCESYKGVEK